MRYFPGRLTFSMAHSGLKVFKMVKLTVDAKKGVNINRGQRPITGESAKSLFVLVTS